MSAQTEEEKVQADLFTQLEKSDVKVASDKAEEMKQNIINDKGSANYLGLGVHDVFIKSIALTKANSGTLGLRFSVENPDGQSDATFWLSEAALPYSIENVSRLVVHNTPEEKKDEARTFMSNITSAKDLVKVAQAKLIDGVAFLSIRQSKTQTYTDQKTGEVKPSLERNLLSYKPKADAQQTATAVVGGTTVDEKTKLNIPF